MIEEYWKDSFIYYVTFVSNNSKLKFTRALIFSHQKTFEEIEDVVFSRFEGIREVIQIDEFDDALLFKEEFKEASRSFNLKEVIK